MIRALILQNLSAEHVDHHLAHYVAVSADVSDWGESEFLKDLPEKWALSFSLWEDVPVAYCIMSRRSGLVHINQFMVAPYARGDGIGASMLATAIARGAQSLKVAPSNDGAIRFYERHGFAIVDRENGYNVMHLG